MNYIFKNARVITTSMSAIAMLAMTGCTGYYVNPPRQPVTMPMQMVSQKQPVFNAFNQPRLQPQLRPQTQRSPVQPLRPMQPMQPSRPMQPVQPLRPVQSLRPMQPSRPIQPIQPLLPVQPMQPLLPVQPMQSEQPSRSIQPLPPIQRTPQGSINQKDTLLSKIKEADFILLAFNDKKFLRKVLKSNVSEKLTDNEFIKLEQCVYYNIDREQYDKELPEVAQYLINNYPDSINDYIIALETIKTVVHKIYNHPTQISFNMENFPQSSALTILNPSDRGTLTSIVNDPTYAPILATIGLPAKNSDGTLEDMSAEQVESMMGYIYAALQKCR